MLPPPHSLSLIMLIGTHSHCSLIVLFIVTVRKPLNWAIKKIGSKHVRRHMDYNH
jgi:hypothetical protein